jgi:hypothetical protein
LKVDVHENKRAEKNKQNHNEITSWMEEVTWRASSIGRLRWPGLVIHMNIEVYTKLIFGNAMEILVCDTGTYKTL